MGMFDLNTALTFRIVTLDLLFITTVLGIHAYFNYGTLWTLCTPTIISSTELNFNLILSQKTSSKVEEHNLKIQAECPEFSQPLELTFVLLISFCLLAQFTIIVLTLYKLKPYTSFKKVINWTEKIVSGLVLLAGICIITSVVVENVYVGRLEGNNQIPEIFRPLFAFGLRAKLACGILSLLTGIFYIAIPLSTIVAAATSNSDKKDNEDVKIELSSPLWSEPVPIETQDAPSDQSDPVKALTLILDEDKVTPEIGDKDLKEISVEN